MDLAKADKPGLPGARLASLPASAGRRSLIWAAWAAAMVCALPVLAVALTAVFGDFHTWRVLADTVLPGYALTTVVLALSVAVGTTVLGTAGAFLITNFRFPLQGVMEIALALPLVALMRKLRAIGYTGGIALELFNPMLWQVKPSQLADLALASVRRLIESETPLDG